MSDGRCLMEEYKKGAACWQRLFYVLTANSHQTSTFRHQLKAIRQSDGAPLLQLEVAHLVVAVVAIVETWIDE